MYSKDELYYIATDLLRHLIHTPSTSREEEQAAQLVSDALEKGGFTPHRTANNVWALAEGYDPAKPTLLLNSHIDTVKPTSSWTRDPFEPIEEEGRLYGLGSNDAGASVVSLLATFMHLASTEQPYNLIFLASAEEEVSGANGIARVLGELPPIDFAVVGEPTAMQPAICEKGLLVLDCTTHGRSGHAAREEGINALYLATEAIEQLRRFEFPLVSEWLGRVKLTVTQIQAGTQHNVVPDRCDFVIDLRTNDCYTNAQAVEILREHFPQVTITPRSLRLNSSSISPRHPFVRRCILTGREPFGSPTLSDQAHMSFPSVKIGPGESARSHTADEYIVLDEIREAIELYICLLDQLEFEKKSV
ncbi:M20 family metallo-hydrolase [Barnesiella sp. An55]|uniref:M20 family metallo-hydrolase n=1 Tax=Barnesiella sp. An55 TaxID=1965646 RepID=UPI000B38976E|nr:M20 family metallo-hydrolase [Barnesiella sp. An55]OUN74031.1 acetylornithine deacetylase [Barnesiella sp. An55]